MGTVPVNARGGVLVIGEALVDVIDSGGSCTVHPGGSPANVALGLGRLGVDVTLLTDLGRDSHGSLVADHLRSSGVHVLDSSFSDRPTSRAVAIIGADGSARYEFDLLWNPTMDRLPAAAVTHTGSIATFLAPGGERVRAHLAESESPERTFDPNIRPALLGSAAESRSVFESTASSVTAVKLSDEDARWLYPASTPDEVLTHVSRLGPRLAVMTLGAGGAILVAGDDTVTVAAPPTRVIDTIGAGDSFMASLIASLLEMSAPTFTPESLLAAGRRAARAAAITVARAGADLPTAADLGRGD